MKRRGMKTPFDHGAFWADLIEDLTDPEFREAFTDMSLRFMQDFHEGKLEEEQEVESYEDLMAKSHDVWRDCTGRKFYVHKWNSDCHEFGCAIHSPSLHKLSDAKQYMREDKGFLIERICEHGVGHPDPDSARFMAANGYGQGIWIHGCDGCCREIPVPVKKDNWPPTYREYQRDYAGDSHESDGWGPFEGQSYCRDRNRESHDYWSCMDCNPYGLGPEDIH